MVIYNTLTKRKEQFKPEQSAVVKIYECGPTVYDFIHIGNARPLCVFDTLRRYLTYKGYDVVFVKNFTDVDDKIINRAQNENISCAVVTQRSINEYCKDAQGLKEEVTHRPKATENIAAMQKIIEKIIENGFAYERSGTIYFRSRKLKEYGNLSGMVLESLQAGARVPTEEQKEDDLDFALWKAAKPGEPSWNSPWGAGRPGWHIECTAMIDEIFGGTIDIHCGGQDLIFPHHENELAQYLAYCGKPLARFWMHNGFVTVDSEKMAKSRNNFITVRAVAEEFGYLPIRLLMLQAHYRTPINYNLDIIKQSAAAAQRIRNCWELLNGVKVGTNLTQNIEDLKTLKNKFLNELEDDFNTASAIGVLFDFMKQVNSNLANASQEYVEVATQFFSEFLYILGLEFDDVDFCADEEVRQLIKQREDARFMKDFKKADELREELKNLGILLEDTISGVKAKKVNGGKNFGQKN
ncbi:MAG: cysteine--tRNA ligase [Oscillospiraceae bacterium]|jgi:cysteinyl-tRNA synthetase|nr:cysteine--tRNA ligase [Oscillospiraceae bacterium]